MQSITLQNGFLTVEILKKGAEIVRVQDSAGIERIWRGEPGAWDGHAPLLFPVCGALKDGQYRLDGQTYALPYHGFALVRDFAVEQADAASATFLLEGDAAYHPGFPFEYALRACYTLRDNALRADLIISNLDDRAFYFSAGAHEAYDCPGEMTDYFVEFDEDETLRNRVVADNGLIAEATEPVPMQGRVLPITPELFAHGTLVLDDLRSRGVTLGCTQNNRRVRVDFPGFDYLLIWKQKGASFLCIEPWHNLPDAVDTDGDIAKKPGMIRIAPGGSVTLTHTLTFF